jgi:3-dehydroquinate dehydratase/shikimate dehydrogenase
MPTTTIIHTVTARDMTSLRQGRDKATGADMVELRLDGVEDLDVAGALQGRTQPVIVTCRPVWEGGAFDGSEETRRNVIQDAVALGAEWVDVERRAEWRPDRTGSSTRLVLSDHDFSHVPADLHHRVAAMRSEGADIVKVAAMAQCAADCLTMRDVVRGEPASVVIAMGSFGRITRVLPDRFGSCWTYGGTAAPGQPSVESLVHQFRVHDVTSATEVYAVTGRPLDHSASPAMHNAAFVAMGRDAVYVPLQATTIADALAVANALDIRGLSVTAPFKSGWPAVGDDEVSRSLGAINTLKRAGGVWRGRNVDGDGFLDPLDARGLSLLDRRVVILGAGGAALAVGRALASRAAHVSLSARQHDKAEAAAAAIGAAVVAWPPQGSWDLVVNATPVGTWPHDDEPPLAFDEIHVTWAYDLVYNPEETTWLREARATGAQVIGGLEMLVGQAVRQSAWWTGQAPDASVMTSAAREWIRARTAENR